MPIEYFVRRMRAGSIVIYVIVGSEVLGVPGLRTRLLAGSLDGETLIWLGPTDPQKVQEEFESIFGRKCMLDCDSFAGIDREEDAKQFYKTLFNQRGAFPVGDSLVPVQRLLPSYAKDFCDGYMEVRDTTGNTGHLSGSFCCDLSQSHSRRKRCGPWLPACRKSSVMASLTAHDAAKKVGVKDGYFFAPNEIDFAHGWPSVGLGPCGMYAECNDLSHGLKSASLNVRQDSTKSTTNDNYLVYGL